MHRVINYIIVLYVVLLLVGGIVIRKALKYRIFVLLYYAVSLGILGFFLYSWNQDILPTTWTHNKRLSVGLLLAWLVFFAGLVVFLFSETIIRLFWAFFRRNETPRIPSRRRFVSQIGMGLAAVPFLGMLHGMWQGKYNFRVIKHQVFFDDLPEAFDGYRIVHISDLHTGSFDNLEKVRYGVEMIKNLNANAIFLTGDIVNDRAEELLPYQALFSELRAEDGVFSVLGNHDYGDYIHWNSLLEKEDNLKHLKQLQKEMGFQLLLNQHHFIERNGQRIAIIGVENWGKGFIQKGDLKKALQGVSENDFKILLSHDPTHWQYEVLQTETPIQLTLSGHTHGMQFGIEIPGFLSFSPASFRYKYWGGLYQEGSKYINVNRGFGYLAFPGRVGMPPEITLIELKRK